MESKALTQFVVAGRRLRPLLNRLVFYGIETCRAQLDSSERVRVPDAPPRRLNALATSQLQRVGPELSALGFTRTGRNSEREIWDIGDGLTLALESSAEVYGTDAESGILEYATLITRSLLLESGDSLRVAALPAQIALLWRGHRQSGLAFSASPWTEDLIELVVRREGIDADVASLPPELLGVVARSMGEFAASDAALWTIARALPDARTTPGSAELALERFRRLAALAAERG